MLDVDRAVSLWRIAEAVAVHRVGAACRIERDVEEGAAVVRPGHAARRVEESIGEELAGREIAHSQLELLGAARVHRPCQIAVVRAHVPAAEPAVGHSLAQGVEVKENFFLGGWIIEAPAEDRVLASGFGAAVVEPFIHLLRHRQVGLLQAADQLLVELLLQLAGMSQHGRRPGVLRLQICDDFRVLPLAQPVELVEADVVVAFVEMRDRADPRRLGRRARRDSSARRQRGGGRGKSKRWVVRHGLGL